LQTTLKKIAEIAQTSQATVSMVLNGKQYHRVSSETRERIQSIAQMLNYQPNLRAQALARGKTGNIAVIVNELQNPFYSQYLAVLKEMLEPAGYTPFPFETHMCYEAEAKILSRLEQGYFDGSICLELNHVNYDILKKGQRLPLACRGWEGAVAASPGTIMVNYQDAIRELFVHLAGRGCRKMAVTITSRDNQDSSEINRMRLRRGMYTELCEHLPLKITPWIPVPFDVHDTLDLVYEKTLKALQDDPEIDSILVHSGRDVVAVYKAVAAVGRRVGKDVAVATFDRLSFNSYLDPEVTYIEEPVHEIAQALVDELMIKLKNKIPVRRSVFMAKLVLRASTSDNRS